MKKSEILEILNSGWKKLSRAEFDAVLDFLDDSYYNKAKKPITDLQYDDLREKYFSRFPLSKRRTKVGHSVGNKRKEVPLPNPMSSLDKIKTPEKIELFAKKFPGPYTVSDKEDGMSLQLGYEDGVPDSLFTRGNGEKGQDISHLIPYLKIPKRIPVKGTFFVRVEAMSANSTFEKHLSKDAGGKFNAVRNAAGGIINKLPTSKDFEEYAEYAKHLTLFAFKILEGKGSTLKPSKQFELLKSLKFKVVPYKIVKTIDFYSLSELLAERIEASDYDIDGLVVEQDVYHKIGHALPKHAVSFKENSVASMVDIPVKDVVWEASRNGTLIPVVQIKPTKIGGVQVSNFTGHNAFYIQNGFTRDSIQAKRGDRPRPIAAGAIIRAVRSGGVIPYIVEVIKPARKPSMPDVEYKIVGVHAKLAGKNNAGSDLQKQKKIEHFFVRIGVDGFKLSTVQRFWENGYTKLSQYLKLTTKDFVDIDGLGARKAQQFIASRDDALKNLTFTKLADASGYLPSFGRTRFDMISDAYPDVMKWPNSRMARSTIILKIQSLKGFKELAESFADALPKIVKFADTYGFKIQTVKKVVTGNKFSGQAITFTGVRDAALQKLIEENGGKVQDMRKDTTIVLIKELGFTSSTTSKAEDLGVPVMTVAQFRKKFKVES